MRLEEIITVDGKKRYILLNQQGDVIVPVARYLKYKDNSGSARNTLRAYGFRLKLYFEFLKQKNMDFKEVGIDDIAEFIQWLRNPQQHVNVVNLKNVGSKRSSKTVNQIIDTVINFYDYLMIHKEYESTLSEKLKVQIQGSKKGYKDFLYHVNRDKRYDAKRLKLKEPIKRPKVITSEDVERILKACKNARDQFLIYLLYETGMRIGEALSLRREDIKFGARKISIRDRGELENDAEIKTPSSERTLDVTPDLMNLYDEYFFDYLDSDEVDTDFVFINISGKKKSKPMAYQAVNSLIKRLREETGVQFSAHVLRHTCLTELWRTKKIRPEILKERAGHKQIQTTLQMYVHPSKEDIAKEWAEAMAEKQRSEEKNVK